jgi:essential nuclear protein 1
VGQTANGQILRWASIQKWSKLTPGLLESPRPPIDPSLNDHRVGLILRGYRSGPLPKLFKVVPTLPAWARILALTRPESWSPHACRAATRLFISTMKPPQAQLFLQVVLLDAIREDIRSNKKLNVHYYEALKRALYKPSAFFKGIIFPMLEVGERWHELTMSRNLT